MSAYPEGMGRVPTVAVAQDGGGAIGAGKVAVAKLPPQWGFRRWASTRPVSTPDRQAATEPPGSYPDGTHTRWRRRAYVGFSYSIPPPTLGARTIRASLRTAFPSGRGRSGRGLGAAPFAWWRGRLLEE